VWGWPGLAAWVQGRLWVSGEVVVGVWAVASVVVSVEAGGYVVGGKDSNRVRGSLNRRAAASVYPTLAVSPASRSQRVLLVPILCHSRVIFEA
jgi:hypothetical protein